MSRESQKTTKSFIEKMSSIFNSTPYILEGINETKLETKDDLLLSVVIPARNEFPNVMHTVHSILNCWEADGYAQDQIEIIIVNNCSDERSTDQRYFDHPVDYGTTTCLEGRGIYYTGTVRTYYDPIAGNHSARNKGARIARGKYVFFSDAHMSYKPGTFKYLMQAVDESGGMVHATIAWMGTYPPHSSTSGYQYTIKLGEEIKGTWANYLVGNGKDWFYIFGSGHCSVMCNRKQFLAFGGYPDIHRTYGGGEFYTNAKWWMFGSSVAVHPLAIGYHLKSYRGYNWNHDDYIHNVLNVSYALGMDDWRERAYINWMRRGRKEVLDRMMEEGEREMKSDREWVDSHRLKSFNDILVERPWDKLNKERLGSSNSSMLIFHDSWLNLLKEAPQYVVDAYKNSKYQRSLEEFINSKLAQYVYKRGKVESSGLVWSE